MDYYVNLAGIIKKYFKYHKNIHHLFQSVMPKDSFIQIVRKTPNKILFLHRAILCKVTHNERG